MFSTARPNLGALLVTGGRGVQPCSVKSLTRSATSGPLLPNLSVDGIVTPPCRIGLDRSALTDRPACWRIPLVISDISPAIEIAKEIKISQFNQRPYGVSPFFPSAKPDNPTLFPIEKVENRVMEIFGVEKDTIYSNERRKI